MITIDPEFRDLIPPLSVEEFAQLKANIVSDGCRDPLVLWGDVLLDGHNRHAICTARFIAFETVQVPNVATREQAVMWIINHQLGRRNLSDYARIQLALRAKPILEAQAEARLLRGKADPAPMLAEGGETRKKIAAIAGVGKETVRKAERIEERATPEVKAAVKSGSMSINAAMKTVEPQKASQPAAQSKSSKASSAPVASKKAKAHTSALSTYAESTLTCLREADSISEEEEALLLKLGKAIALACHKEGVTA